MQGVVTRLQQIQPSAVQLVLGIQHIQIDALAALHALARGRYQRDGIILRGLIGVDAVLPARGATVLAPQLVEPVAGVGISFRACLLQLLVCLAHRRPQTLARHRYLCGAVPN